MQVVISSAFETSIGIAQYACLALAINQSLRHGTSSPDCTSITTEASLRPQDPPFPSQTPLGTCAHGLATEDWFQSSHGQNLLQPLVGLSPVMREGSSRVEGMTQTALAIGPQAAETLLQRVSSEGFEAAAAADTCSSRAQAAAQPTLLEQTPLGNAQPHRQVQEQCSTHEVVTAAGRYSFSVCTVVPAQPGATWEKQMVTGGIADSTTPGLVPATRPVCVFLHGFLGDKEDWLPIMRALALTHRCVALDLPGHGKTLVTSTGVCFAGHAVAFEVEVIGSNLAAATVAVALLPNYESTGAAVTAHAAPAFCRQPDTGIRSMLYCSSQ